jgi:ceramide glucosyltransferase
MLALLALLSLVLTLWQWLAVRKFPLHRRAPETGFAPAVSLLKPLKGCDDTTADSLRSWFHQNYPGPIQILFGVADAGDPVGNIVRQLIAENPESGAQLVLCGESLGANAKVSTLAQLEKLAKHDLILVSDADVRVPPDFVANIVVPMNEGRAGSPRPADGTDGVTHPAVGLVNCFYRLANPSTTAMQWEAVAINADFWSQVMQSHDLKSPDFALGAALLVRRAALAEIGGFQSLAGCLADDYQLGQRIAQKGHRIVLCPVVVECWCPPMNWRGVWQHQLRWARTIRVSEPLPYFFSILSNATLWPLLWLAAEFAGWAVTTKQSGPSDPDQTFAGKMVLLDGAIFVMALLLVRIGVAQDLQRRMTGARAARPRVPTVLPHAGEPPALRPAPFWLVPVKDLLQAAIWVCAFTGDTVEWRGRRMKLRRDGTLTAEK